ncbi:hypothetical protein BHM03_00041060, partial [Ensete ventricosum]
GRQPPYKGPWLQPAAPAGGLAMASRPLARGLGRNRLPLATTHGQPLLLIVLTANALNDSMRFNLITRSLKPIFRTKTLALIPLLGNLSGCITCAAEIKTKTSFPRRSNRRAKDWGREKNSKTDKFTMCERLILPREIVYPCIPDPDGQDEGGQASSSLAVSTRWISVAKLVQSDLTTLAQMEGGE